MRVALARLGPLTEIPRLQRRPWPAVRDDIIAGVVVGIIALPLSIALAVAVGVSPIAGLYTAVFAGAVAAIFGGSPYNITGPTAALVPLLAHAVLAHGPAALPVAGLIAGLLLLAMSYFRLGRLIRFMPRMVILGFTAGIALSLAFGQLNNFLAVRGTDPANEHFHQKLWDTIQHLDSVGWTTPLVGIAALAVLVTWTRLPRANRIPGPLIAVLLLTAITWGMGVDTPTIASLYGEIPRSLPRPSLSFFDLGLAFDVLPVSVAIAILGGVESLLSATVADGMSASSQRHNPDLELRGQGLANLVSPIMGGIPATAAIARTAAGIKNGGTTRLTGVSHAIAVLMLTLVFGGLAGHIPLTVLAAILLVVAWNIADADEVLRMVRRAPREDIVVLMSTMLITLFFDLTYAIGFGVLVSMVLVIRHVMDAPAARELLPNDRGHIQSVSPELSALIQSRPDIDFFTAQGVLSFHSAAAFEYSIASGHGRPLILRLKDVDHIDATGAATLEGMIEHHQERGGRIILTAVRPGVLQSLERFGVLDILGRENVFEHTRCAIDSIEHDAGPPPHEEAPASTAGAS